MGLSKILLGVCSEDRHLSLTLFCFLAQKTVEWAEDAFLRAREDASLSWAANVSVKHQTLDFVCKHELCVEPGAWQHWQKTDTVGPSDWLTGFWMSAASLRWLTVWQGDKTCIALGMFRQAWDALCLHIFISIHSEGYFPSSQTSSIVFFFLFFFYLTDNKLWLSCIWTFQIYGTLHGALDKRTNHLSVVNSKIQIIQT